MVTTTATTITPTKEDLSAPRPVVSGAAEELRDVAAPRVATLAAYRSAAAAGDGADMIDLRHTYEALDEHLAAATVRQARAWLDCAEAVRARQEARAAMLRGAPLPIGSKP